MHWDKAYRKRGYVIAIKWSIILFFITLPFGGFVLANIVGLIAGIIHHNDSTKRIDALHRKTVRIST